MYKRLTALLLAVLLVLGNLPMGAAYDADLDLDAPGDIWITTAGADLESTMNYLKIQDSARGMDYTYYMRNGVEIPVYCCEPTKSSVTSVHPDPGSDVLYEATEKLDPVRDADLIAIMACGYPNVSIEELGVEDKYQAFYATKTAIWASIQGWTKDDIKINDEHYTYIEDEATSPVTKVLAAYQKIVDDAAEWKKHPSADPKVVCTPDYSLAYPVTIAGTQYLQQSFTLSSASKLKGNITLSLSGAPLGTRIVNASNGDISSLTPAGAPPYNFTFKVLIPVSAPSNGKLTVSITGKAAQYAVYLAKQAYGGPLQNYLVPAGPEVDIDMSIPVSWQREAAKGTLEIKKVEKDTGAVLSGAVFSVTDPHGKLLGDHYTTDAFGKISIPDLEPGLYTVREITPPAGHLLSSPDTMQVYVPEEDTGSITFENAAYGSLIVTKTSDTGDTLEGVTIELSAPDGSTQTGKTGPGGTVTFSNLAPGLYYVRESEGIKGYEADTSTRTPVQVKGNTAATLTLTNRAYPGLKIEKLDRVSHTPLENVRFRVSKVGSAGTEYSTGPLGTIEIKDMEPGTYIIEELESDKEHVLQASPRIIELKAGDGIVHVLFYNERKPGMHIVKADDTDGSKTLPGAVFLIQAVGSEYGAVEYTTGPDGTIDISLLDPGFYTVTEKTAPEGYLLDPTPHIVELVAGETAEVVLTNQKLPDLTVRKVDEDNQPLPGATFVAERLSDGTTLPQQTTGRDGMVRWENLQPGVWAVREVSAPAGYARDTEDHIVRLFAGRTGEITLQNKKLPSITIQKQDSEDSTLLAHVSFALFRLDGTRAASCETNDLGIATLDNLEPGVYCLREIGVPTGYLPYTDETWLNLQPGDAVSLIIQNTKRPSLTLKKTDTEGNLLKDAVLSVETLDGDPIGTFRTGLDGTVSVPRELLNETWYRVTEITAPAGFDLDPTPHLIYLSAGKDNTLVLENAALPGLTVRKLDAKTGAPLPDAWFEISVSPDGSGAGLFTPLSDNPYKTNADGQIYLTDLQPGWYKVREVQAPEGYLLADPEEQLVYLAPDGGASLTFEDMPKSAIVLVKQDRDTGLPLPGARFQVRKLTVGTNGPVIGIYETGIEGAVTIPDLDAGTYLVQEIAAPADYEIDPMPQTAVLTGADMDVVVLTFNDVHLGSFRLEKRDGSTGLPLSGAQFRITSAAWGSTDHVYTTGPDGVIYLTGITPGETLTVQEVAVPDGYVLDTSLWAVPIRAGETATLALSNQPKGDLILQKTDSATGKPLAQAQFKITDPNGNAVGPEPDGLYETDRNGRIRIDGIDPGVYCIAEVRAPEGYARVQTTSTVTVHPGETLVVSFPNTALGSLLVRKVDSETGAPIQGVRFRITDAAGMPAGTDPEGIYETDAQGQISLRALPAGGYRIQEMAAPAGYQADDTVYTAFVSDGATETIRVENHPLGGILIHKQDATTGEALPGVQFKITDGNGIPMGSAQGLYETDHNGDIYLKDIPDGETLVIQETKALPGYILDDTVHTARAKSGQLVTVLIENARKGGLIVEKVDAVTGEPLPGAEFLITTADGTFVPSNEGHTSSNGRYTTDQDGRITLYDLQPGTYVVTELRAPDGYVRETASQTVQVFAEDTQTLTFPNMPQGGLIVQKIDSKTQEPIPGVQFQITDAAGNPAGTAKDGIYTTDEKGLITLPDLKAGTYVVTELEAAQGYVLDDTAHTITVSDGEAAVLAVPNTPMGGLELRKIEAGTRKPLKGAEFTIAGPDGQTWTVTTDAEGKAVLEDLIPGTYTVRETKAPEGYILSETASKMSVYAGETAVLTLPNQPYGRLELRKIDAESKQPLGDAQFMVSGPEDKSWTLTTDQNGMASLEHLVPGTYTVREIKAPDGYVLTETVYTVSVEAGETAVLAVPNAKIPAPDMGVLMLVKLDSKTKAPLADAVFQLIGPDGTKTTLTTDNTGTAVLELQPGTYELQETTAPKGYALDGTVRSVLIEANKVSVLEALNTREQEYEPEKTTGTLELRKTDETQPNLPVSGAAFAVYAADGTLAATLKTDSQGKATVELAAGEYYAVETGCPEEYILDSTRHPFTVEAGKTVLLQVSNRRWASIRIHKMDSKTHAGIPNVSFQFMDNQKHILGTYTTDAEGWIDVEHLDAKDGPFWLQETAAAPGYVADPAPRSLSVTPGKVVTVDWFNDPVSAGSGRIQITKTAAADCPDQGIAAGDALAGAAYTVTDAATGEVLGTMETGPDGTALTKDLPLGRYYVAETKAPDGFRLDTTPMIAEITASGEVVRLTQRDWPLTLGVSITKTGNQEIQPGQVLSYTLSNIANTSEADLEQFYWRDTLPAGVQLLQITTGTYNVSLPYQVEYKTNLHDYRVLADGLDSKENHAFAMSAEDLDLVQGEFVTAVRLAFGTVPAGFQSIEDPIIQVQVPEDMASGTMIRNVADVGGRYGDAWLTDEAPWETVVRVLDEELPKTGF